MVQSSTLYTNKAFDGGSAARKVLDSSLQDKAAADRLLVLERLAAGMSLEEAAAPFLTDEAFTAWLTGLQAALTEAVTVSER